MSALLKGATEKLLFSSIDCLFFPKLLEQGRVLAPIQPCGQWKETCLWWLSSFVTHSHRSSMEQSAVTSSQEELLPCAALASAFKVTRKYVSMGWSWEMMMAITQSHTKTYVNGEMCPFRDHGTSPSLDAVSWGDATDSYWGMVRAKKTLHHQSSKPEWEIPQSARLFWVYRDLHSMLCNSEDWGTSLDMKGKFPLGNKMHLVPIKASI